MENIKLINIRSIATFSLAVLYLVNVLVEWEPILLTNYILLVIVLILSLFAVQGASKVIGYSLFLVGGVLLITHNAEPRIWLDGISRNLYLLAMFTLVPLLGAPIRQGGYMEALRDFFRKFVSKNSQFYFLVKSITFLISVMINIGSIPLMHQISAASEKIKNKRLVSNALTRGFAASIVWAPSYAAVALVLDLTQAEWIRLFPHGIGVGIMAIILGWMMTLLEERSKAGPFEKNLLPNSQESTIHIKWKKIIELIIFGTVLILSIAVISQNVTISTVTVVAMISLVFPAFWLGLIGKISGLSRDMKGFYFQERLPNLKNEAVIFLGAGFLATAIGLSAFGELAPILLGKVVGDSPVLLSAVIMTLIVLLSVVGIHPIISVTVIGSFLQAELYNVSPTFIALILISGWALGVGVSPTSGTNITTASLVKGSFLQICKWNARYTVILLTLIWIGINIVNYLNLI